MEDPLDIYQDVIDISSDDEVTEADNYPQKEEMTDREWRDELDDIRAEIQHESHIEDDDEEEDEIIMSLPAVEGEFMKLKDAIHIADANDLSALSRLTGYSEAEIDRMLYAFSMSAGTYGDDDDPYLENRINKIDGTSFESYATEDAYILDDQTQYDGTPYQSQAHYVNHEIEGHFKPADGNWNGSWDRVICNHCGIELPYDQAMGHMLNTHDTTTNANQAGYTNFGYDGGNEENNWTGTFMPSGISGW